VDKWQSYTTTYLPKIHNALEMSRADFSGKNEDQFINSGGK
jgi:hypothetical protein